MRQHRRRKHPGRPCAKNDYFCRQPLLIHPHQLTPPITLSRDNIKIFNPKTQCNTKSDFRHDNHRIFPLTLRSREIRHYSKPHSARPAKTTVFPMKMRLTIIPSWSNISYVKKRVLIFQNLSPFGEATNFRSVNNIK